MKLSSAMTLGSCLGPMEAGNWNRCALGRALQAVGGQKKKSHDAIQSIFDHWPWLEANHEEKMVEIMELFDQRVCAGDMTLNELIEFIRSVEPPCDCATYGCCCERVTDAELLAITHNIAHSELQGTHHSHAIHRSA